MSSYELFIEQHNVNIVLDSFYFLFLNHHVNAKANDVHWHWRTTVEPVDKHGKIMLQNKLLNSLHIQRVH